ncbi:hypothetical protein GGF32_007750 [Allomyces javanicus]|nr:hypothetical protein GGF32_007750 [Allomyces javanicus]
MDLPTASALAPATLSPPEPAVEPTTSVGKGKISERKHPYETATLGYPEKNFRKRAEPAIGHKMKRLHTVSTSPTFLVQLDFVSPVANVLLPNGLYLEGSDYNKFKPNYAARAYAEMLEEYIWSPKMWM